jgi:hypothetical protein
MQVGVLHTKSMEIEEEPLRPFRAAPFDGGPLPFKPDKAKVLGATGTTGQQQAGQNDQRPAKELHETASTLTQCTVETVSWGVSARTIIFTIFYYLYNLRVYHDDVGAPGPKSGLAIVSSGFGRAAVTKAK